MSLKIAVQKLRPSQRSSSENFTQYSLSVQITAIFVFIFPRIPSENRLSALLETVMGSDTFAELFWWFYSWFKWACFLIEVKINSIYLISTNNCHMRAPVCVNNVIARSTEGMGVQNNVGCCITSMIFSFAWWSVVTILSLLKCAPTAIILLIFARCYFWVCVLFVCFRISDSSTTAYPDQRIKELLQCGVAVERQGGG